MSPGAKAGIGVGVSLGALGLIALLLAVFMLRRRKQTPGANYNGGNVYNPNTAPDTSKVQHPGAYTPELPGGWNASELGGTQIQRSPVELDGARY